jgi:hypothetical protein
MRRWLFCFLFPWLTLASLAGTVNVTYTFTDFQLTAAAVRRVTQTPLQPFADYNGAILTAAPATQVSSGAGAVTFSNTVAGFSYRVQLDTPYGSTVRTCGVPVTASGNINGRDYLGEIKGMNFYYLYPFSVAEVLTNNNTTQSSTNQYLKSPVIENASFPIGGTFTGLPTFASGLNIIGNINWGPGEPLLSLAGPMLSTNNNKIVATFNAGQLTNVQVSGIVGDVLTNNRIPTMALQGSLVVNGGSNYLSGGLWMDGTLMESNIATFASVVNLLGPTYGHAIQFTSLTGAGGSSTIAVDTANVGNLNATTIGGSSSIGSASAQLLSGAFTLDLSGDATVLGSLKWGYNGGPYLGLASVDGSLTVKGVTNSGNSIVAGTNFGSGAGLSNIVNATATNLASGSYIGPSDATFLTNTWNVPAGVMDGSINMGRLPHFWGNLYSATSPLVILGVTDLTDFPGGAAWRASWAGLIGLNGGLTPIGFNTGDYVVTANAGTVRVQDATIWPDTAGLWNFYSTNILTFSRSSTGTGVADTNMLIDTIKVFYVIEPGAGKFLVQTNGGGGWATVPNGTIDCSGVSLAGGVTNLTVPQGYYSARVSGSTGKTRVWTLGQYLATGNGVTFANIGINGDSINQLVTENRAVVDPWFRGIGPSLVCWLDTDGPRATPYWSTVESIMNTDCTNADAVYIGMRLNGILPGTCLAYNAQTRSNALYYGRGYFDQAYAVGTNFAELFLLGMIDSDERTNGANFGHFTTKGLDWVNGKLWNGLGLNNTLVNGGHLYSGFNGTEAHVLNSAKTTGLGIGTATPATGARLDVLAGYSHLLFGDYGATMGILGNNAGALVFGPTFSTNYPAVWGESSDLYLSGAGGYPSGNALILYASGGMRLGPQFFSGNWYLGGNLNPGDPGNSLLLTQGGIAWGDPSYGSLGKLGSDPTYGYSSSAWLVRASALSAINYTINVVHEGVGSGHNGLTINAPDSTTPVIITAGKSTAQSNSEADHTARMLTLDPNGNYMELNTTMRFIGNLGGATNLSSATGITWTTAAIPTNTASLSMTNAWITTLASRTTAPARRSTLEIDLGFVDAAAGTPVAQVQIEQGAVPKGTNTWICSMAGGLSSTVTNHYSFRLQPSAVVIVTDISRGSGSSVTIANSQLTQE